MSSVTVQGRTRLRGPRSAPFVTAAGTVAAAALVVAMDPQHTHVPLCPFHSATGLQCPFCGSLRAVNALARGHWTAALHDNLLFVAALPVVALLWLEWVSRAREGRVRQARPRWAGVLLTVGITVGLVAFTVVRNLPAASALRP